MYAMEWMLFIELISLTILELTLSQQTRYLQTFLEASSFSESDPGLFSSEIFDFTCYAEHCHLKESFSVFCFVFCLFCKAIACIHTLGIKVFTLISEKAKMWVYLVDREQEQRLVPRT
jgi:hypothetical protein